MSSTNGEIFNSVQERQLLWFALRSLRLAPPAEFFNLLQNDHIVQVYAGSRQVYRTFNYYSVCSYSLEELEITPWQQLFSCKDPSAIQNIISEKDIALLERRIVYSKVPPHLVIETASPLKNEFLYDLDFIVPLTDLEHNAKDCFMLVFTAELVKTLPESMRQQKLEEYETKRLKEKAILKA